MSKTMSQTLAILAVLDAQSVPMEVTVLHVSSSTDSTPPRMLVTPAHPIAEPAVQLLFVPLVQLITKLKEILASRAVPAFLRQFWQVLWEVSSSWLSSSSSSSSAWGKETTKKLNMLMKTIKVQKKSFLTKLFWSMRELNGRKLLKNWDMQFAASACQETQFSEPRASTSSTQLNAWVTIVWKKATVQSADKIFSTNKLRYSARSAWRTATQYRWEESRRWWYRKNRLRR